MADSRWYRWGHTDRDGGTVSRVHTDRDGGTVSRINRDLRVQSGHGDRSIRRESPV